MIGSTRTNVLFPQFRTKKPPTTPYEIMRLLFTSSLLPAMVYHKTCSDLLNIAVNQTP